jgi:hypothetical protein
VDVPESLQPQSPPHSQTEVSPSSLKRDDHLDIVKDAKLPEPRIIILLSESRE